MPADYPGKIVERLKTAVNNLSQSLSSDVGEDDDEILAVSTAGAPDSGSFHLENEIVFYPEKSSIKYGPGLTRGADGTTKSIHLKTDAGGEIKFGPEAHHINYPNEEIIAIQTVLGITGAFNFATLVGAETLTNKILTSPVINTSISGTAITPLKANEIICIAQGFNINGSGATPVDTAGTAAKCYAQYISALKTHWFDFPKFVMPADYDGGAIEFKVAFSCAAASKKHSLGIRAASVASGSPHNPDLAAAVQLYNEEVSDATIGDVTIKTISVIQATHLAVAGQITNWKFVIEDDAGADADATFIHFVRAKWNKV